MTDILTVWPAGRYAYWQVTRRPLPMGALLQEALPGAE